MKCDKYKEFLTKGNMMGSISIRLLEKMLSKAPEVIIIKVRSKLHCDRV